MSKIRPWILFAVFALGYFNTSRAITITWTGCDGNDWHTSSNWSPAIVPKYTDVVVIPNVATVYPVITGIACCASLDITSTATDALTINTTVGGVLHVGNSAPVPLEKRFVFVSSVAQSSTTSPASRDARCNTDATAAGLCGTYKAWVSKVGNSGNNNVSSTSNIAYYMVDGTKIADSWADLTDGTLDAGINKYATGAAAAGFDVWTGLNSAGVGSGTSGNTNCGDWGDQTTTGRVGVIGATNSTWTDNGLNACQSVSYTYVGGVPVGQGAAQCATCFPGTVWYCSSCSCGGNNRDASCAATSCIFCCADACGTPNAGVAISYRHYCFQQ